MKLRQRQSALGFQVGRIVTADKVAPRAKLALGIFIYYIILLECLVERKKELKHKQEDKHAKHNHPTRAAIWHAGARAT